MEDNKKRGSRHGKGEWGESEGDYLALQVDLPGIVPGGVMIITPHREERISKGDIELIWDTHLGKYVKVKVYSITQDHVTVIMPNKMLWTIPRKDYLSLRETGRKARTT